MMPSWSIFQIYCRERKHWCPTHRQMFVCLKGLSWNVRTKICLLVQLAPPFPSATSTTYIFSTPSLFSIRRLASYGLAVCSLLSSRWLRVQESCHVSGSLRAASGCCAFKRMLSHSLEGRENTAGTLLQLSVCWQIFPWITVYSFSRVI